MKRVVRCVALVGGAALCTLLTARPSVAQQVPTFSADVAPILLSQCADCHRPGGSAPFNLITYADAKRRARLIADTVTRRYMPPWKPEPGFGEFDGVRRLTDEQIDIVKRWAEAGAPEGDAGALPPVPTWRSSWTLGEPDLVLK